MSRYRHVSKLFPPRVLASLFRTAWNGWCIAPRFQSVAPCCLNCSPTAVDSIEHYVHRPLIRQVGRKLFGVSPHSFALEGFLCVAPNMNERELAVMAVICYAAFRTTSACRGAPPKTPERIYDMLEEHCKTAVADTILRPGNFPRHS